MLVPSLFISFSIVLWPFSYIYIIKYIDLTDYIDANCSSKNQIQKEGIILLNNVSFNVAELVNMIFDTLHDINTLTPSSHLPV